MNGDVDLTIDNLIDFLISTITKFYDEFISKMDLNIKNRQENVMVKVEDAFFVKLHEAL